MPECWLSRFSDVPCEGKLRTVHILPKRKLKEKGHDPYDPRSFIHACGGLTGLEGHHGAFDYFKIKVPREAIPQGTEELAEELGLLWYLAQRFGERIPANSV